MKMLLLLCVLHIIQMTSSQPTYDINDVTRCGMTDQVLKQLVTAVHQLQRDISQLLRANSQLQRDVAELKAANQQTGVKGKLCVQNCINSSISYDCELNWFTAK